MPIDIRPPVNSVGLKFLLVCFLAGLIMVPVLLVWGIVWDRTSRLENVRTELSRAEGGPQDVIGPHLLVPYTRIVTLEDGKTRTEQGQAFAYARTGSAKADLKIQERRKVHRPDLRLAHDLPGPVRAGENPGGACRARSERDVRPLPSPPDRGRVQYGRNPGDRAGG